MTLFLPFSTRWRQRAGRVQACAEDRAARAREADRTGLRHGRDDRRTITSTAAHRAGDVTREPLPVLHWMVPLLVKELDVMFFKDLQTDNLFKSKSNIIICFKNWITD